MKKNKKEGPEKETKVLKLVAANSSLNKIKIIYGEEVIQFNLYDELKVSEALLNIEIKQQPRIYGFLLILRVKLARMVDDLEVTREKVYAQIHSMYKDQIDENTQRPYNDDRAKYLTRKHKKFLKSAEQYNMAKENFGVINACVKAFEQRADLIQSLSANVRKERG